MFDPQRKDSEIMGKYKIGDAVISFRTGKVYIIQGIEDIHYKCFDTEGKGHSWFTITAMDNSKLFGKI